jgi:hypothetical protein
MECRKFLETRLEKRGMAFKLLLEFLKSAAVIVHSR